MKTFEIEIQEILLRSIRIEADTQNEAVAKAHEMYRNEEVVLDADDYIKTDIIPIIDDALI